MDTTSASRPSGYVEVPDYRIDLLRRTNRIEARSGTRRLALSTHAIIVDEQDHALVVYFPRADVDMTALVPHDRSSHCPFKHDAQYWALATSPGEPIAWSYPTPYPKVVTITDHIAFNQDKIEIMLGAESE